MTLALEPEVASIYIGALNVEKSRDASSSDVTLVKSAPGARFMVVDIGGIVTLIFNDPVISIANIMYKNS